MTDEPMYLISESEMRQIQNDCAYPCRVDCVGCDHSRDWGCEISANGIIDEIVARGPVQQAPAVHELPAYICDEDNLGDIHDILTAALAGNDLSTLPRRWNQELGIIHSRSLAEHDAALIAQEREKWERERDQKYVLTLSALREISADVELKDYRKSCIHDPVCQWLCTAGNCPFHVALDRHNATIAAQAREGVLAHLTAKLQERKSQIESVQHGNPIPERSRGRIIGLLDACCEIESLRSEVGK